jgi:hypothetical protein
MQSGSVQWALPRFIKLPKWRRHAMSSAITTETTITHDTPATVAVVHAVMGGKFRLRLHDPNAEPGRRFADVLNDADEKLGGASDYIYRGTGFAVHTGPYGGYVSLDQVEFV